jgi:hypothetical protein
MRLTALMLTAAFATLVLADAQIADGEWMTAPGQFQERDTLTVQRLADGKVSIYVHTVFCPTSNQCMNARFGGMQIEGVVKGTKLRHSEPGCEAVVSFSKNAAVVKVTGCKENFPNGGPRRPFRRVSASQ